MAARFSILTVCAVLAATAQAVPLNTSDAQTCIDICTSCKGVAKYDDDTCECDIEGNTEEEAENVSRLKREANERGLDLLSCNVSDDKRSTRCTLGLKAKLGHKLGLNNIDQIANYFMQDGPLTGNIFQASPVVGKSSQCLGSGGIVGQPAETLVHQPQSLVGMPNLFANTQTFVSNPTPHQHFVSSPSSHFVSSPSSHFVSSPGSHFVSSPVSHFVSSPGSSIFSNVGSSLLSSPGSHIISSPGSHFVSSPSSNCLSSPSSNLLGASAQGPMVSTPLKKLSLARPFGSRLSGLLSSPRIDTPVAAPITQPLDTFPEIREDYPLRISNLHSTPDCGLTVGSLRVGAINPVNFPSNRPSIPPLNTQSNFVASSSFAPLLRMLGKQLSYPMLGIPQALQTISQSPGIGELVSAPGTLLSGLISNKLGDPITDNFISSPEGVECNDNIETTKVEVPKADNCDSTGGSEDLVSSKPTFSSGDSTFANNFNPTVGAPMTQISYLPQMPAYMIPQMPAATYIVGSPVAVPFFNPTSPPVTAHQSDSTLGQSVRLDQQVGKPQASVGVKPQKKICKKSNEEIVQKVTRDVKGVSESITDEELEKQSKIIEAANQQAEQNTTELPKIDRTTTQKTVIQNLSGQKPKVERSAVKIDKAKSEIIGKIKPAKEITKKPKEDKKNTEKRSAIKN